MPSDRRTTASSSGEPIYDDMIPICLFFFFFPGLDIYIIQEDKQMLTTENR